MKRLLILIPVLLIIAAAFLAIIPVPAAIADCLTFSQPCQAALIVAQAPHNQGIAQAVMDLSGVWDVILFYNDGGMDREIWHLTQDGDKLSGYSQYPEDQGDIVRGRITGIIKGSFVTISMKSGPDYIKEFRAAIRENGTSMGTRAEPLEGATFQQMLRQIDESRAVNGGNRPNSWENMDGQWWGQKRQ